MLENCNARRSVCQKVGLPSKLYVGRWLSDVLHRVCLQMRTNLGLKGPWQVRGEGEVLSVRGHVFENRSDNGAGLIPARSAP